MNYTLVYNTVVLITAMKNFVLAFMKLPRMSWLIALPAYIRLG
jgi:hypothetical protein